MTNRKSSDDHNDDENYVSGPTDRNGKDSTTTTSTLPNHEDVSIDKDELTASTKVFAPPASVESEKGEKETHSVESGSGKEDPKIEEPTIVHPFVQWAQSHSHITLRVDLSSVENLNCSVDESGKCLNFTARGSGGHGLQDYQFSLDFYEQVERKFECHSIERYVLVLITKVKQEGHWPRLTQHRIKFPWLRVDFDRYTGDGSSEDDCEDNNLESVNESSEKSWKEFNQEKFGEDREELEEEEEELRKNSWTTSLEKIFSDSNTDIFNPFNKRRTSAREAFANMKYDYRKETVTVDNSKNTARQAMDFKKTYLFLYNLVMFIMFLKVIIVLVIKGISGTVDDDVVQRTAFIVKLLTWTQLLETVHPMLGLVPGGPLMPFTQVLGRIVVNYFLTEPQIRLGSAPYAHYLFLVWTSIEIFRYSYYALKVFKVTIYALTWCRYTLFLPLYPCGGICETMVILSTIKHYEKTGGYSTSLPNAANISFNLPWALRIYILILFPTIYNLMKYMWRQRGKQLKEKVA